MASCRLSCPLVLIRTRSGFGQSVFDTVQDILATVRTRHIPGGGLDKKRLTVDIYEPVGETAVEIYAGKGTIASREPSP